MFFILAGRSVRGRSAACPVGRVSSRGSCTAGRALGLAPPWSTLSAAPTSPNQSQRRSASYASAPTGRSALTGARYVIKNKSPAQKTCFSLFTFSIQALSRIEQNWTASWSLIWTVQINSKSDSSFSVTPFASVLCRLWSGEKNAGSALR